MPIGILLTKLSNNNLKNSNLPSLKTVMGQLGTIKGQVAALVPVIVGCTLI